MDSGNKVSPNTPEKAHDEASTPSKATARGTLYSAGISLIERAQAGELDPLVGRDEEVARIFGFYYVGRALMYCWLEKAVQEKLRW